MNRFRYRKRAGLVGMLAIIGVLALLVAGCGGKSTPSAFGAFVVGDGSSDSKVHDFFYPNQKVDYNSDSQKVLYVPLNSRNYLVNDGTTTNANHQVIGDIDKPIRAKTSDLSDVLVQINAYWTLNRTKSVLMNQFWDVCAKYNCASKSATGGPANFSEPGWNGMLGEVFLPALTQAVRESVYQFNDDIWKKSDPAEWKRLADLVSSKFGPDLMRQTGYDVAIFCGSGTVSFWPNPNKVGVGEFHCGQVRMDVTYVSLAPPVAGDSSGVAANNIKLNALKLEAAKAMYGDQAGYWLGLQDTISECKDAKVACVINVGSGGATAVPVPSTGPVTTTPAGK